ncbi:hypothetical protein SAMN05444354_10778 [Stigmatella aurantiaca]|uniref:Outer membrane protein beta-barrel domain-containing protein n=2 Tax=Stigmatella aurantiaca TaxID=41 RepID=A0A1H7RKE7_STIAU|nr:hypothetical protein SAMN05444354_10778 [Stigmatella aurantiaca]
MTHPAFRFLLFLVLSTPALAQERSSPRSERWSFGAVVAPVTMPEGMTSLCGYVGVPEMGAGFRQGLEGLELEAKAKLDYFRLAGIFEVGARRQVLASETAALAPTLSLGLVLNSGTDYLDEENFGGVLLRLSPGLVAGWRAGETVVLVGLVDVPIDIGLSPTGAWRIQNLVGGGPEIYLGQGVTLLLSGQIGLEHFREDRHDWNTRLAYQIRLGIGSRMF